MRVDKFILPADFVVLDMDQEVKVTLILGRSVLATTWAQINVGSRKLVIQVGNDEASFRISKITK